MAPRHLAVPTLPVQARLLRERLAGRVRRFRVSLLTRRNSYYRGMPAQSAITRCDQAARSRHRFSFSGGPSSARSPRHSHRPRRVDAHGHGHGRPRRRLLASARLAEQRAFQGQPASLWVVRPSGVRCAASVRYADATLQRLPSVVARTSRASWRWEVTAKVKTGSATAAVSCGKAGKSSRAFTVAGPPSAPRVVVLKNGFSQRVVYTTRRVSFGAELSNPSPENDALSVDVQVDFINATNRVIADGASPSLRSAQAPSTTWAARRTSPTRRPSPSSRS